MKFSKIKIPSNRKFGIFFSLVFILISFYFYYNYNYNLAYFFIFLSIIFILITIIKDNLLFPLNKLWMRFGFILSIIIMMPNQNVHDCTEQFVVIAEMQGSML